MEVAGLAVNPVSLAECLRPWHSAGVTCLVGEETCQDVATADMQDAWDEPGAAPGLHHDRAESRRPKAVPDGAPAAQSSGSREEALRAAGQAAGAFGRRAAREDALRGERVKDGAHSPETTEKTQPALKTRIRDEHSAAASRADAPAATAPKRERATPGADWPQAWRELLAGASPAPVVWTYAELGDDLAGSGSKERSACLRRIIGSLRLAKGSSAFWPVRCAARAKTEDMNDARFFQEGLRRLAPKIVIMLGRESVPLSGLDITLSASFTQQVRMGVLYVLLPDFTDILSRQTDLEEKICAFLRMALAGAQMP
jgi:hypothetical protein